MPRPRTIRPHPFRTGGLIPTLCLECAGIEASEVHGIRPSGRERKAEGIGAALANPSSAPWRVVAYAALLEAIRADLRLTSETITARAGVPSSPNQVGATINGWARRGLIRRVGFVNAERSNQHAALIAEWEPTELGRRAAVRGGR